MAEGAAMPLHRLERLEDKIDALTAVGQANATQPPSHKDRAEGDVGAASITDLTNFGFSQTWGSDRHCQLFLLISYIYVYPEPPQLHTPPSSCKAWCTT